MNNKRLAMSSLPIGREGIVISIEANEHRRRFFDLGILPDTIVRAERYSPTGNPIAFNIRGTIIAIRRDEASNVLINMI